MGLFDVITKFIPPLATTKAIVEQAPKVISGQSSFETAAKAVNTASGTAILTTGAAAAGLAGAIYAPTTTGKVVSSTAGLVGAGYFSKASPQQTITGAGQITGNTISGLYNVGGNIQGFSQAPSLTSGAKIFQENPVIAGGLAAGAAILAGKGAANLVSNILNTSATRENTAAILGGGGPNNSFSGGMPITTGSPTIESATPSSKSLMGAAPTIAGTAQPVSSSMELIPEEQAKKRAITPYKRKKTKNINKSPITIRNYNIMAVRNHG